MGTRSLTVIVDEQGKEIAVLYRQMDGQPDSHGKELVEFLRDMEMTQGLVEGKTANGMNCLAAQIIAHFKTAPGGFYLYAAGTRDAGEEYIYTVRMASKQKLAITVTTDDPKQVLFKGTMGRYDATKAAKKLKQIYG